MHLSSLPHSVWAWLCIHGATAKICHGTRLPDPLGLLGLPTADFKTIYRRPTLVGILAVNAVLKCQKATGFLLAPH